MRLFLIATLVYAKTLKKIQKFKTPPILCEGNVDEEWHGSASNDSGSGDEQGSSDEANQKNPQEPTKAMKSIEQCKKPNNVRKTKKKLYMKSGTGAPATAVADREAVTEQRMPTNEIVLRDHQCKE